MKKTFITINLIILNFISYCQTISYNYDSLDRLTQVIYPDSSIIIYSYDASGNRTHLSGTKSNIIKACPQTNVTFQAGTNDPGNTYQWQVNVLNGFVDVVDDGVYSGSESATLLLTMPPTSWYGYKYRCVITDIEGDSYSPVYTLKFEARWLGSTDTEWETASNWNCALLPDEYTDVMISATAKHFPEVNSTAVCRSVSMQQLTSLLIKPPNTLEIKGE